MSTADVVNRAVRAVAIEAPEEPSSTAGPQLRRAKRGGMIVSGAVLGLVGYGLLRLVKRIAS